MLVVYNFFGLVLSIGLYVFAPDTYSFEYCLIVFFIYVFFSIQHIISRFRGNYFTFNVFFLIAMLFTNFIYPIFYYSTPLRYFGLFKINYNEDVITRATVLCLCAMMSYFLGASLYKPKIRNKSMISVGASMKKKLLNKNKLVVYISLLLFVSFLLSVGPSFLSGQYVGNENWEGLSNQIYRLLMTFLPVAIIVEIYSRAGESNRSFFSFVNDINNILLIVILIFTIIFLWIGDRGGPIVLVLFFIGAYTKIIRGMKLKVFLILLAFGAFLLTVIGKGRVSEASELGYLERVNENWEINSNLDFASGLIINNRSLYVLYDYVQTNDHFLGLNLLSSVIGIFPSLERLLSQFPGYDTTYFSTANFVTYLGFGDNPPYGLGTNMIGGLYLSFGFIGVIMIMFLFGRFIAFVDFKSNTNFIYLFIYLVFLSYALSLPRTELLSPLRMIVWGSIIYWFFFKAIKSIRI